MSKIRLSEEHGLNPSVAVCFFCGKDKGVVVLGKLKGDAKAPRRAIYDYRPCDECREKMSKGVTIIECATAENGNAPIGQEGAWPTGRWCVISDDAASKLFKDNTRKTILLEDRLYEELVKKE